MEGKDVRTAIPEDFAEKNREAVRGKKILVVGMGRSGEQRSHARIPRPGIRWIRSW